MRIGFFLHIPFPPTELFAQLPWRRQILDGLLGADLVGFQRPGARARTSPGWPATGWACGPRGDRIHLPDDRIVRAEAFPISIDVSELEELARQPETDGPRRRDPRASSATPRTILLGVDRLDYTKGIRQRLRAFGELLDEKRSRSTTRCSSRSRRRRRERVEQYRVLRDEIELLVGRINGELRPDRYAGDQLPAHVVLRGPRWPRCSGRRTSMVVTPLRDGMNLVAKEYVACRYDDTGALVLSEFAGAADELRQAFLVNPHDINGMKDTIVDAMNTDDRAARPPDEGDAQAPRRARREHLGGQNFLKALHDED